MNGNEFIDLRDQLNAYINTPNYKFITITVLSGDRYTITRPSDILMLARVVFVFQHPGSESCFYFDSICNVDVVRKREI